MSELGTNNLHSREAAVDQKFWLGLSDWAVDLIGSTAAGVVMRDAYQSGDPQIVLRAIDAQASYELATLEPIAA